MKKKILALLLCAAMMGNLLPVSVNAVEEVLSAKGEIVAYATTFQTSEAGAEMIASFEGFSATPYLNGNSWYIGYGTACNKNDYPQPITEEKAMELLRAELVPLEEKLNAYLTRYGISLKQHQFDALMSLSYNLGTTWMSTEYRLGKYLLNGIENYPRDEVVNSIATWCHVGKVPSEGLAVRRLQEAKLFLDGVYENDGEKDYVYIHYIAGAGEVAHTTLFYPVNKPYGMLQEPAWSGKYFQGWYTAEGQKVTADMVARGNISVTAAWGDTPSQEEGITPESWTNPYTDVSETDWFFEYVKNISIKNMVEGYPDHTYRPYNTVTAGEALKMLLMATGHGEQAPVNEHWASGYYALAIEKGYLAATDLTDLDKPIDRELIAQITARAMGIEKSNSFTPFYDTDDGYAIALYYAEIFTGSYTEKGELAFYPNDAIIRSEIAAILWRVYQKDVTEEEPPVEETPENPDGEAEDPSQQEPSENPDSEVEEPSQGETPDEEGTGSSGNTTGEYITYGDKKIPVLAGVPVNSYDKNAFSLNGSILSYNVPGVDTSIGIDVSTYQGDIDWEAVAASGVEYAFIRAGFRGYGTGSLNLDAKFQQNIEGALKAGIKVGAYIFSQAITVKEAVEEADFLLDAVQGYNITYPLVFDWETVSASSARTNGLDSKTLTDCAIAFCERVEAAGYHSMIYFNQPIAYLHYQLDRLTDYDFWYAQYPKKDAMVPSIYYDFDIWQYTSSGSVPGIKGNVDMNLSWKRW